MTNKPMLSVEQELRAAIEQALLAIKRIHQAGYDSIIAAGGACDQPGYMTENDPTVRELRAILDKEVDVNSHTPKHHGEPVRWERMSKMMGGAWWPCANKAEADEAVTCGWTVRPLFAEQPAPVACTSCDGSGEHIDAIGDWRGYCECPAGVVAKNRTYPPAPSSAELDIESAAKKLAECMDYPWQHMADQGRQSMRDFAKLVIEAGAGVKP